MTNYIVTIARQFGSLGRPIAKKIAEELKIEFYDRDIVEETAKKLQLPVSLISEEEEKTNFFTMKYPLGMKSREVQNNIYNAQRNIILALVEKQPCIIVGRCADSIFKKYDRAVHIYIYAPFEKRLNNCIKELGMKKEEAVKMITEVDKARMAYHKRYAGFAPDDPEYHELMIDSSVLGVDGTAGLISKFIKERFDIKDQ